MAWRVQQRGLIVLPSLIEHPYSTISITLRVIYAAAAQRLAAYLLRYLLVAYIHPIPASSLVSLLGN